MKKQLFALLVAATLTMINSGVLGAQNIAASPSHKVKRLAFERYELHFNIFVMMSPDSKAKRLVENAEYPALSPDGEKVAYCANNKGWWGQIHVINVDGSGHRQLTNLKGGACEPDWSPDGEKVAFTRYGGETPQIFVMDKDGQNTRRVTEGREPRWSPDGNRLMFLRQQKPRTDSFTIWKINVDGSALIKITDASSMLSEASWLPDGNGIAYSANRELKQKFGVFRASLDGTGVETIVSDRHHSYFFPLLSPDARELVAATTPDLPYLDGQIMLVDLSRSQTSFLTYGLHPSVVWEK